MKKYFVLFTVFTIFIASGSSFALAKEHLLQTDKTQVRDDASFEKMTKVGSPNEIQVLLTNLMGEWNYSVTVWTGPNAKPDKSIGTSVNETILEGRFLSMKSSIILNIGGNYVPYEANGLMGYDNIKRVFASVWIDNLNPGMMVGTGTFDKKTNIIKESGNFTSAIKNTIQTYRSELQFTDANSYQRAIFSKDKSGKEYKVMEFIFHRKK